VWVKVCGLTRESDVDAALEAGADALGFVLAESPRQVSVEVALRLAARASGIALSVAVVVNPSKEEVTRLASMDAVQVHGKVPELPSGMRLLKAVTPLGGPAEASSCRPDWLLVDASQGTGAQADWSRLSGRAWRAPLILAGGLRPDNVGRAIEIVHPFGVDVSSGVERALGIKDAHLIAEFIGAAKSS
jgi:phosphoribosylanthranilate isomerase